MTATSTRVAIVGSGLIGRAWAIVFAGGGCRVALHDSAAGVAAARMRWRDRRLAALKAHKRSQPAG